MTVDRVNRDRVNQTHERTSDELVANTGDAPIKMDQEWANALTHGIATLLAWVAAVVLIYQSLEESRGLALACTAYMISVIGTFGCSTLSHVFLRQPLLDTLRAYDQAMIYTMISGTYTPIVFAYAPNGVRTLLLIAIWVAAGTGFVAKIFMRHRINSIGTASYLLLGWLPAIPLAGHVPGPLVTAMIAGGVLYSLGVVLLVNDSKVRYLHAGWHLFVIAAAACHYFGILWYT